MRPEPSARFGGLWARELSEVTDDLGVLDRDGRWAVLLPYRGRPVLARFEHWTADEPPGARRDWAGPTTDSWTSSAGAAEYVAAVARTREAIAAGSVYQANVCRVLSAPLPDPTRADVGGLDGLLAEGNPAPFGGFLRLPDDDVAVATASPELFLRVRREEHGRVVRSGPIKGTATTPDRLLPKDRAENVMIVDLVRNDLSRVCQTGTVTVPSLLRVEEHPGLVHLVSEVAGLLRPECAWSDLLDATFPPGSVTGAPKVAALELIERLEPVPRGPYCGAVGWVDATTGEAELAVAIRTFWVADGHLHFGTGAGITWGSDAWAEWAETELKAARLTEVAAGTWHAGAVADSHDSPGQEGRR